MSSVWKLYYEGADFVLALSTVTGEILFSLLIEEREIVTPDVEFESFKPQSLNGSATHSVNWISAQRPDVVRSPSNEVTRSIPISVLIQPSSVATR